MNNKTKNLIPITIIIVGVLIGGILFYTSRKKCPGVISGDFLSPQDAAQKAIDFINENMLPEGVTASLVNVVEEEGLYKFHLKVGDQEFDSYVTQNGKLLFLEGIDLSTEVTKPEDSSSTSGEVPKSDIPDVKLFVMSYCPYGLQAQKMFLPVYELLGEKAEMEVYFVNYIMHEKQEIDENLNQYCIQKEEKEKYANYLSCFVEDGDFEGCLTKTGIDRGELASCISDTDKEFNITSQYNDKNTWLNGQFPKFDVHASLNEQYGVRGSPTVVINDTVANINPRSPENFKKVICQAFTVEPEECSQSLSEDSFSPGFGLSTSSSSGGSCE
jgi:hypothetical protein